jgi:anti-anti-sigma factor
MRIPFGIETTADAGVRSIKVTGELDSGTCDAVLAAFERALRERGADTLVLDLKEVSFIDSSGMRAMIQLERDARGRGAPLMVVPPPDDVTELLRIAGIAERMNLVSGGEPGPLGVALVDRVDIELDRAAEAPGVARGEVREALAGRLADDDVATVVLLTSEIVTNAVIHPTSSSGSAIGLSISVYGDGVRIEVDDDGQGFDPGVPTPRTGGGGQGLSLVDRCARRWGAGPAADGRFRVWFEFLAGDREPAAVSG